MAAPNYLYYGDNLDILRRHIPDESVDLVYLDPPFNSNRSYNVLFKQKTGEESQAQIEAFDDTWTWSHEAEAQYQDLINGGAPLKVADAIEAMRRLLGDNDVLAYLVMMTARLAELHRVLKPTGTLYLHCDPTASHYLKVMLDAAFGPQRFVNEIVWQRAHTVKGNVGQGAKHFGRSTDSLLFYAKGDNYVFNQLYEPYSEAYLRRFWHVEPDTGRHYRLVSMIGPGGAAKGNPHYQVMGVTRYWRYSEDRMKQLIDANLVVQARPGAVPERKQYLDEGKGIPIQSLWTDVVSINPMAAERLGYPTQKPLALLERIIKASSNEGGIVLDPFCGCGTTIDAAEKLGRHWIGIDITYLAVDLIEKRLRHTYGDGIIKTFRTIGIPRDLGAARRLFESSPFDFERWAVSLVDGQPQQRSQVGDKGVDGVIRFPTDGKGGTGRIIVSVKGGKQLGPQMVRDLGGTVAGQRAAGGILVTLEQPTRGMIEEVNRSGLFDAERHGRSYPKLQILTVAELLSGKRPKLPPTLLPYMPAQRRAAEEQTLF